MQHATRSNHRLATVCAAALSASLALAGTAQDDTANRVVLIEIGHMRTELPEHADCQCIQLVRAVQGQDGAAILVLPGNECVGHDPRSTMRLEIA